MKRVKESWLKSAERRQVLRNNLQISFLILSEFKRINFYYPWNYQKTYVSDDFTVNIS